MLYRLEVVLIGREQFLHGLSDGLAFRGPYNHGTFRSVERLVAVSEVSDRGRSAPGWPNVRSKHGLVQLRDYESIFTERLKPLTGKRAADADVGVVVLRHVWLPHRLSRAQLM